MKNMKESRDFPLEQYADMGNAGFDARKAFLTDVITDYMESIKDLDDDDQHEGILRDLRLESCVRKIELKWSFSITQRDLHNLKQLESRK